MEPKQYENVSCIKTTFVYFYNFTHKYRYFILLFVLFLTALTFIYGKQVSSYSKLQGIYPDGVLNVRQTDSARLLKDYHDRGVNITCLNKTCANSSIILDYSTKAAQNVTSTLAIVAPTAVASSELPKCPEKPPGLLGRRDVFISKDNIPSFDLIKKENPTLLEGGHYRPPDCVARSKVAILIPFRNRDEHLHHFLHFMHPILQRQQVDYRIYIINQMPVGMFNRAKLLNVGFVESLKDYDFECFVFHDVDLILENDYALYSCPSQPRHLAAGMSKFNYRMPYSFFFGGASELTKEQFERVNGFSNLFWGWGGEDDELYYRIRAAGMKDIRYPIEISRFKMFSHGRDTGNEPNPKRFGMLENVGQKMKNDGLNTLKYKVISKELNSLYTNITVDIFAPVSLKDAQNSS